MKKTIELLKHHTGIHYAMIFLTTLIMAIPAIHLQISETHDGHVHLLRLIGTNISIANTEFPHLIIPYFCRDFGYSMNLFYGVFVTYIPLLLKIFPISYVGALKLFAIGTIFFSGITMYRCMVQMTKKKTIALVSALLYMTALYRFEDIYTRFAMGEFAAFIFLPMILQGLHNILNEDGKKAWILGIGMAALVLTHTITTLYFVMICILYVLLHGKRLWRKKVWKTFIVQAGIVVILTAFYTVPMLEHKAAAEYTIFDSKLMRTNGQWTSTHTADWQKFFGVEENQNPYDVRINIGIPILTTLLLGMVSVKTMKSKEKELWTISMLLSIISLFMCTRFFPWYYMPDFFCTIQYPWRMNGYFVLFASMAGGIGLYVFITSWKKEWIQNVLSAGMLGIILTNTVYYTTFYQWEDVTIDEKYETYRLQHLTFSHMEINRDYLPVKALYLQRSYVAEREDRIYVLQGTSQVIQEEKEGLDLQCMLQNGTKGDIVELPYFFYLGYEVKMQIGEKIAILPTIESQNGFLAIVLPEDIKEATITVHYTGTVLEKISYAISGIGVMGYIVYYIGKRRSKQKNEPIKENAHSTI